MAILPKRYFGGTNRFGGYGLFFLNQLLTNNYAQINSDFIHPYYFNS